MDAKKVIQDALDYLLDDLDADPRARPVRDLQLLLEQPDSLPDGEIELTAILQPGGAYRVHDQHGRTLKGVKSVAVFPEQNGQTVFQVNL